MSLSLIATPIGHEDDITVRALNKLRDCPTIVGEEAKVLRRRLSTWSIPPREKRILELNEHSSKEDIKELLKVCQEGEVALVTDCGTPSFFDPGFALVKVCREHQVKVQSLPGVSSLTALFPFLDRQTESFEVLGFPPRESDKRKVFFEKLNQKNQPFLILDTPYRLLKTCENLQESLPSAHCCLGINLTCQDETVVYGRPKELLEQIKHLKKENFVCMVYPD